MRRDRDSLSVHDEIGLSCCTCGAEGAGRTDAEFMRPRPDTANFHAVGLRFTSAAPESRKIDCRQV